jgi:putative membrane protein insertion efficiency factor
VAPVAERVTRGLLLLGISAYQRLISPLLGPRCRFHPTCSAYAAEAVIEHGAFRGSWLALRRVTRCHPLNPGGIDPVPTRDRNTAHG